MRFICKQVCIAAANSCVMRDDMTIILVQFKKDAKSTENKDHRKDDFEAEDPNPTCRERQMTSSSRSYLRRRS